jgi:hypothetical protein
MHPVNGVSTNRGFGFILGLYAGCKHLIAMNHYFPKLGSEIPSTKRPGASSAKNTPPTNYILS